MRWLAGAALLAGGALLAAPSVGGAADGAMATTVTLTSSENPSGYGDPLVLTATVIPAAGTTVPDGTVTFSDGDAILGTVTLNADGQAPLANHTVPAGAQDLEAQYSGSDGFAASTSAPLVQVVTVQPSTTLLISALNPATYGETVVAVAVVLPVEGVGAPTGTVTLLDGTSPIASAPLTGGSAAFAVPDLESGDHTLTAAYAGDGNVGASASASVNEEIDRALTSTSLQVAPSPAQTGQPVTLTASVTSPTAQPDGEVTFSNSQKTLGTADLEDGEATLTTTFDQPGERHLSATYAGDKDFEGSQSPVTPLLVDPARKCRADGSGDGDAGDAPCPLPRTDAVYPSLVDGGVLGVEDGPSAQPPARVTIAAAPGTVNQGQVVTLTSVVFGSGGKAPTPSGTVRFVQGPTTLGSTKIVPVGSTGDALACLSVVLPAGAYPTITAQYLPDAAGSVWYSASTSQASAAVTVKRSSAPTTLSLASSENPVSAGGAAILTATVNHPLSSLVAGGSVSFTVAGTSPSVAKLNHLGQASLSLSGLAPGSYTVTAAYQGDTNFAGSSGTLAETVLSAVPPVRSPPPTASSPAGGSPTATGAPPSSPATSGRPSPAPASPSASAPARPAAAKSASTPISGGSRTPGPIVNGATPGPSGRSGAPSGSGAPGGRPQTSEVPPIGLISLVSGIHLGSAPQIIVFLIVVDVVLAAVILLASRRGRRLTRRSLEPIATPDENDDPPA